MFILHKNVGTTLRTLHSR